MPRSDPTYSALPQPELYTHSTTVWGAFVRDMKYRVSLSRNDLSSLAPGKLIRVLNALIFALLLVANWASSAGLLGKDNSTVSKKYSTLLTPAGWAFAIWGLIFTLQGIWVVYQVLPYKYQTDGRKEVVVNAVSLGLQVGWLLESVWLLAFSHELVSLSLVIILGALASFVFVLARTYLVMTSSGDFDGEFSPLDHAIFLATSVNVAWLSVASSISVLIVPTAHGVKVGPVIPILILVTLAAAASMLLAWKRDVIYGLTLVWACVAIHSKQEDPYIAHATVLVGTLLCIGCVGAVAANCMLCTDLIRRRYQDQQSRLDAASGRASQASPQYERLP